MKTTQAPPKHPSPNPNPGSKTEGKHEAALRGLLSKELWPQRTVLYVREVAATLHITEQHVANLISEGRLRAVNIRNGVKTRRSNSRDYWRIPVSAWDAYILENAS
jgi:hypothetical protein